MQNESSLDLLEKGVRRLAEQYAGKQGYQRPQVYFTKPMDPTDWPGSRWAAWVKEWHGFKVLGLIITPTLGGVTAEFDAEQYPPSQLSKLANAGVL